MPKVSVVIPTCTRPHLIKRTVDSVLKQTFQDFEIIIVDDGLKERAEEVVKNIKDERIKYIQHEVNKGGGAARNTGIKATQGDYIAFLDDDDEWAPDKLEKQINLFEKTDKDVGFCYTAVNNIYDEKFEKSNVPDGTGDYHDLTLKSFKKFLTVTLLIKKEVFGIVGVFDEKLPSHQEAELMIRVTEKYKGVGINEPLVNVNMKSGYEQIGKNISRRIGGEILVLEKHLQKYKTRKKYLAKHYFQIGLWYRDSNDDANARKYFLMAWRLDFVKIRYLLHFLINILKHNKKV